MIIFHEETLKAGLWYSRHPNNARKNYNATKELYIYLAYLIPIMYGDFCFQYVNYKHRLYELIGVYTYITKPLLKILFNTFKLYKHELKYRAISEVSVKLDDKHQNKNEMKFLLNIKIKNRNKEEESFHAFIIHNSIYNRFFSLCKGEELEVSINDDVIYRLGLIILHYYILDSGSVQSSVIPSFKMMLKTNYGIDVELFGSSINTSVSRYGSIFSHLECKSLGSFFDMDIVKGNYEINGPFNKIIS